MIDFNINPIGPSAAQDKAVTPGGKAENAGGASFGQWLDQSINEVNQLQKTADDAALRLATGENKDIHGTMINMQKADVAMNLMMEVRNKVIAAYEEVKRMQF